MRGRTLLALALLSSAALDAFAQQSDPAPGRNLGRNLAAACANCHGTDGRSAGGTPALAGRDRTELARLMQDFKSGKRPATVMHQIAKGYSDEQVEAIAAYFSAQKAR